MPDKTPAVYRWAVGLADGSRFHVDACIAVTEDTGHMALIGPEREPVFLAEPGTGCTFTRQARAEAAAAVALVSMLTGDEAEIAKRVAGGGMSINDGRRALGLKPFDMAEAEARYVLTADGPVDLAGCRGQAADA